MRLFTNCQINSNSETKKEEKIPNLCVIRNSIESGFYGGSKQILK